MNTFKFVCASVKTFFKGDELLWRILGSIAIPFVIDMVGREESILIWIVNKYFWINLFYGFIPSFLLLSYVKSLTGFLYKKYADRNERSEKILLQIILGIVLTAVLVHLYMFMLDSSFLPDTIFHTTWMLYEFPFIILIIISVNVIYGYHFLTKKKWVINETNNIPTQKSVLLALKGFKNYPIPVEEIAYIYREDNTNRLVTFSGNQFVIEASLEEIMTQLNPHFFFRANRQYIINFKACLSFSAMENNKLELNLVNDHKIVISQKTGPSFKNWMNR